MPRRQLSEGLAFLIWGAMVLLLSAAGLWASQRWRGPAGHAAEGAHAQAGAGAAPHTRAHSD